MNTYLIMDASNLVYRTFFANLKGQGSDQSLDVGISYLSSLQTLAKYHRQFNANDIVIAFDMPNSWRKAYTKDKDYCVTRKIYKGHRRQNLTESEKRRLADLDTHLQELSDMFKTQTGLITLKRKHLEADDLIAGFVQKYKDDKHVIVSSDKDFLQLLSNGNVTLIDPATDKARDLSEWDYDAKYFMFEKCFRGDIGDNVQSSYPRLTSKKIKEAYVDEFKRANILNHAFVVEKIGEDSQLQTVNYATKDLFEENQLLMDLTQQPEYIRELIDTTIDDAVANRGKYNHFNFIKFCGKHELVTILNNVERFASLLSGKGKQL